MTESDVTNSDVTNEQFFGGPLEGEGGETVQEESDLGASIQSAPTIQQAVIEVIKAYSKEYGYVTTSDIVVETEASNTPASRAYASTILHALVHDADNLVTRVGRGKYAWSAYLDSEKVTERSDSESPSNRTLIQRAVLNHPQGATIQTIIDEVHGTLSTGQTDETKAVSGALSSMATTGQVSRISRGIYGPPKGRNQTLDKKPKPKPKPKP